MDNSTQAKHFWRLDKFSRYKSKWESITESLKLTLDEAHLSASLTVTSNEILVVSLDLSNVNVQSINLSLYSKNKTLYGKCNDFKFQMKFFSILDLDSFQTIVKKWVIVKQYYEISNSL